MNRFSLLLFLLALPSFAQQGNTLIDWLTSVQAIEASLATGNDDASAIAELRALPREIVAASEIQTAGLELPRDACWHYRGVELQVGLNNLLDRNYVLVQGYPGAGRNFYTNLRYRF
jgi:hypothetical protein